MCVNVMQITNPGSSKSISIKAAVCHIMGSSEIYIAFCKLPNISAFRDMVHL